MNYRAAKYLKNRRYTLLETVYFNGWRENPGTGILLRSNVLLKACCGHEQAYYYLCNFVALLTRNGILLNTGITLAFINVVLPAWLLSFERGDNYEIATFPFIHAANWIAKEGNECHYEL